MSRPACLDRRALLTLLMGTMGSISATMLSGCEERQHFNALNITGATYAQGFDLLDQHGQRRTLADFRGKAVLVFFGYTQCPDICPTTLNEMVEIKRLLGPDGNRLQTVFISVDPERDTQALLKNYIDAFDPSFVALRGTAEETAAVAKAFKVVYRKAPGKTPSSYTVDHTAAFFVFDPQGHIRLYVRPGLRPADLVSDLQQLLPAAHPS